MLFSKHPDDVKRFLNMTDDRRKLIDATPPTPLPEEYGVNKLSKDLHPLYVKAQLISVFSTGSNCKTLRFKSLSANGRFPYFRAGQYVTLSKTVDGAFLTRPYSISSSPKEALNGILEITVQRSGIFSTYLTERAEAGDEFLIGEPSGDFCHDGIRDCNNVVAVAGGSGVTPFLSMIKSIAEGSDDFNLLLVYGAKTRKDLLLDYADVKSAKVKSVIVLADDNAEGYEHGFITAELLDKYAPETYDLFMCGPNGMYDFI
ncbi:MAG: FAD-binding oxidoreductase, partial [Corallococcus sp.]|nr:FAD-binding oxidoreductase [Corallococcus sp.]